MSLYGRIWNVRAVVRSTTEIESTSASIKPWRPDLPMPLCTILITPKKAKQKKIKNIRRFE